VQYFATSLREAKTDRAPGLVPKSMSAALAEYPPVTEFALQTLRVKVPTLVESVCGRVADANEAMRKVQKA